MSQQIHVQPLSWLARTADVLMVPIMYIISGTFFEAPQQTHFWNNTKLKVKDVGHLNDEWKVFCKGSEIASSRWWSKLPLFHIQILGGWKEYIVLQPDKSQDWHIGWIAEDVIGISRVKVRGPVRVLCGPNDVNFFGISVDGEQIQLREISRGKIGSGGNYAKAPLL